MEARTVRESQVTMSQLMLPSDANPDGFVHGGAIMKLVDTAAAVAAMRHARRRVATVCMDSMTFLAPARVGDLVTIRASVNDVGRTSLEVGVRVDVEDLLTGRVTHTSSAYLVLVALDRDGRPTAVPGLVAETPAEQGRMEAAKARRARREWARQHPLDPAAGAERRAAAAGEPAAVEGQPAGGAGPALSAPSWLAPGRPGRPLLIGHRGAAGLAPENTLAAFERGLALGVDVVECDVHLTRDGRLAVIHDATVDRTTNGSGLVGQFTLGELQALDAGSKRGPEFAGQRIPSLEEVLAAARGRARVAIEVKQGPLPYPGIEVALVEALVGADAVDRAIVISFDHTVVRRVRELCPGLAGGVLYVGRPVDPVALALAAGAQALMPEWSTVTAADVELAHQAGLAIVPWTANGPEQIARLLAAGVDGVTSDYPDRLLAAARG